ncbi:hypothetical protein ACWPM1_04205 [Tsuneonella sp. HG249]
MAEKFDSFLFFLLGAGWSDRKVRDLLSEVSASDPDKIVKRFRALKRATSAKVKTVTKPKTFVDRDRAINQALKLLRSVGPYSESELRDLLVFRRGASAGSSDIPKGGMRALLEAMVDESSPESMLAAVKSVRNDLVHNPAGGWTTRDLR